MFGRRPDGKRLRSQDPIVRFTPYLMPMRCDAQVFLQHNLDYEKMSRYIVSKSRDGEKITFENPVNVEKAEGLRSRRQAARNPLGAILRFRTGPFSGKR